MPSDVTHATLLAVDVVSKTSVFAAGRRNHVAQSNGLLIHWDGQTWMTLPSPKASLDIIQLSARSDTDVYALSQARFDSLGCKRWDVDHWDGVAWTRIARYTSVCGAEPSFTDLLAVPAGPLLVTGQTPQVQPVADCYQQHCPTTAFPWMGGNGQGWISDADGSSKSDIWLIGNSTRMVVDHWGGTTWSTTLGDTYPTAHQVNAIAEISPSEAWLVGTRETSTGGWRTLILHDQAGVLTDLGGPNVGTGDNRLIAIAHVPGTASEMWAIGAAGTAGQVILHHS
jgi:hypothetical protein